MADEHIEPPCRRCGGSGYEDFCGLVLEKCPVCHPDKIAAGKPVKPPHNTTDDLMGWAQGGCPEGVSGTPQDVIWLITALASSEAREAEQAATIARLEAEVAAAEQRGAERQRERDEEALFVQALEVRSLIAQMLYWFRRYGFGQGRPCAQDALNKMDQLLKAIRQEPTT